LWPTPFPKFTEFCQDLFAIQWRTAELSLLNEVVELSLREIAAVFLLVEVSDRSGNDVLRGTIAARPDSFFDQLLNLGRQGVLHGLPLRTFYASDDADAK
jgi:hypothetical protein